MRVSTIVDIRRLAAALAALLLLTACGPPRADRIVVGSKNFTEQLILGEIIAQQIENKTHLPVERRFYLAGSYICHQAILGGRIDIYPEYTGTALTAILKEQAFQRSRTGLQPGQDRIREAIQSRGRTDLSASTTPSPSRFAARTPAVWA